MQNKYDGQHRGGDDAYERYLRGMDSSMRQKVALTAAHLLGEGTVADMGMGSGSGTLALASLYPRVRVIGVDINPEMVERASDKHRLPNLEFRAGDIAEMVFEAGALDGIFDSSVLHHVTSFNGYDHDAAARALATQVRQLAVGGSLVVRDFVAPPSAEIWLDLPTTDGDDSDAPARCSSAALFERFAREFRKLSPEPGFGYRQAETESDPRPLQLGWRRYVVDSRLAAEFLLRKDYRNDWDSEVLEEYTYFTQQRFEQVFAQLGLRVLASIPLYNPWIIERRFKGRAQLWSTSGQALPFPATNHLIVGEKVNSGDGVCFRAEQAGVSGGFLIRHRYFMPATGAHRDLLRRPGNALDVVPWFRDRGALYVLARKDHPRPVLTAPEAEAALDGALRVGYVTEPILSLQSDMPLGLTVEAELERVAGVSPERIRSIREAATYYPSPGGIAEEVRAVHVEIEPTYVQRDVGNFSGFSTAGTIRAMDAQQVLRAAQVGALPDARLELNVYELLLRERMDLGPWLGAEITMPSSAAASSVPVTPFDDCTLSRRRAFAPSEDSGQPSFLELSSRWFAELDGQGNVIHRQLREYAVPATRSCNTLSAALLRETPQGIALGLDEDDLAAAQCFTGSSAIFVTPAWRLSRDVTTKEHAEQWLRERIATEYGYDVLTLTELGGRYHPSAGITPEVVYPYAVVVGPQAHLDGKRSLRWVLLRELVAHLPALPDGHLRVAVLRAAHALSERLHAS